LQVLQRYREKNAAIYQKKALELLDRRIEFVEKQILSGLNAVHCPPKQKTSSEKTLKWTGTQMEFVELVYALHEASCFGNISLKDLFHGLGQLTGCEVKNHYRLFWDIKNRVAEERTFFLNKLRKILSDKLVRMDSGGWR